MSVYCNVKLQGLNICTCYSFPYSIVDNSLELKLSLWKVIFLDLLRSILYSTICGQGKKLDIVIYLTTAFSRA